MVNCVLLTSFIFSANKHIYESYESQFYVCIHGCMYVWSEPAMLTRSVLMLSSHHLSPPSIHFLKGFSTIILYVFLASLNMRRPSKLLDFSVLPGLGNLYKSQSQYVVTFFLFVISYWILFLFLRNFHNYAHFEIFSTADCCSFWFFHVSMFSFINVWTVSFLMSWSDFLLEFSLFTDINVFSKFISISHSCEVQGPFNILRGQF